MYSLGYFFLTDKKKSEADGRDISSVLTKLKFIGTIKPKEKLDVKHLTIQRDTYWNAFWRMVNQESWENTVEFFDSTYNDAFQNLNVLISRPNKTPTDLVICQSIIRDIRASLTGIKHAQVTYWYDRLIICRLQTLIDMTTFNLERLKEIHPSLFPDDQEPKEMEHTGNGSDGLESERKESEKNDSILLH